LDIDADVVGDHPAKAQTIDQVLAAIDLTLGILPNQPRRDAHIPAGVGLVVGLRE
jgi:hypothetical protein